MLNRSGSREGFVLEETERSSVCVHSKVIAPSGRTSALTRRAEIIVGQRNPQENEEFDQKLYSEDGKKSCMTSHNRSPINL